MKRFLQFAGFCLLAMLSLEGASRTPVEPPHVASLFPAPGSQNVPGVRIQVVFDKPVNAESISLDVSARQADGSSTAVPGDVEMNEQRTSAVFRSHQPLPAGQVVVRSSIEGYMPHEWRFEVTEKVPLQLGRGGPILLALGENAPFGKYLAEILRAEGFTNFATIENRNLVAQTFSQFQLVITAGKIPDAAVRNLADWVSGGGNLITVRPSGALAYLAGVHVNDRLPRGGYVTIDTSHAPGAGLVKDSIQFHGTADIYQTDGEPRTLATLSASPDGRQTPAVTLRNIGGNGGEVAAIAFNLPQSVVLTRQGNPQWAGQDRDGQAPIRTNDLFFGKAQGDPQPDFLDLTRVSIPQADEQMRLLTNLIMYLQRDASPIPRFWYFPNRAKVVLVMAADDHGTKRGTQDSFNRMLALDDKTCIASKWQCARATSWLYASSGLDSRTAKSFAEKGFNLGSHVSTHCKNWTETSLDAAFAADLSKFRSAYPEIPPQQGSRLHCLVWSEFTTQASISRNWGIRFDMNYYYWPDSWVQGRAGFMTGSGIPMRFSTAEGDLIDVYQQETHLVDEVFYNYPAAVEKLIQRGLGEEQAFGAFGTHYDFHNAFDTLLMGLARKYNVPMVSAQQMLEWQDGKSQSDILEQSWNGEHLDFTIVPDKRTHGMLTAMLPLSSVSGRLVQLDRDGETVAFATDTIKGVKYALFPGLKGTYRAFYRDEISSRRAP